LPGVHCGRFGCHGRPRDESTQKHGSRDNTATAVTVPPSALAHASPQILCSLARTRF
jgi:hypothetical protein